MKKRFFAKHAKSSAMVVSLAIPALLIVVALSFVAVTVIQLWNTAPEKVMERTWLRAFSDRFRSTFGSKRTLFQMFGAIKHVSHS